MGSKEVYMGEIKLVGSLVGSEKFRGWCKGRNSHRKCSIEKVALKNLAIFTGKHLCWRLFLIKFQA